MTEYYLWLLQLMGPANPKSLQLIQHYGNVKNVYKTVVTEKNTRYLSSAEKRRLSSATLENAQRIMEECKEEKVRIVTLDDPLYPYRLQNIYNPPILLFYKGSLKNINNEICVAGVGARGATSYTARITRHTCTDLARLGTVLVSGMASGVDHLVHQSAIDVGEKTIGVLACGFGVDYPKGSIPTRERIYELGGACISELLPYTKPTRTYFHARNRIISGLSMGTMIFQAGANSGALITAEHALQQGRDLFCVPPHDIFSSDYSGVIKYLREGAIPLFNYLDVVNSYFDAYTDKLNILKKNYTVSPENHFIFERKESVEHKTAEASQRSGKSKEMTRTDYLNSVEADEETDNENESLPKSNRQSDFSPDEYFEGKAAAFKAIYDYLKDKGQQTLDNIIASCEISSQEVSGYLLEMEFDGVVESKPGSCYAIVK